MKRWFCLAAITGLIVTLAVPVYADGRRRPVRALGGGHVGFRSHVIIGAPFWGPPFWGPPWYWGPYWYPYPNYVPAPPVVIREEPQVYVQQQPPSSAHQQESYWYYCADAKAYYPYVKECPGGWLKVVPSTTPPGQ